jgi:hypothetical protein
MGSPLLLQFSIALFAGMVGATFVPPVRRSIPRPVEVCMWIDLIIVCLVGATSITDPGARELSASAVWGVERVINSLANLALGGVLAWTSDHHLDIAKWLVVVAGVDILILALIRSKREARLWQPRVRLREWMELPLPASGAPARSQADMDPVVQLNRRVAAAFKAAGAALKAGTIRACGRLLYEVLPREARRLAHMFEAGRARSRAQGVWLQEATSHLGYAGLAWFATVGEPVLTGLAARLRPSRLKAGRVVDLQPLLTTQSNGWYGPLTAGRDSQPPAHEDEAEEQADRLAS